MKKILIFVLILINSISVFSQLYFNKIIPYDFDNPLASGFLYKDNKFYIDVIPPENYCTLLSIEDSTINYYNFDKFVFSYFALNNIADNFYFFGKDRSLKNNLKLVKYNPLLSSVIWEKSYKTRGNYCFPNFSVNMGNYLYCGFKVDFKNSNHREIGIKKIDTLGNEIWSKDFNTDELRSYIWEMLPTKDSNLVVSSKIEFYKKALSYGQLMKLDSLGNIIWKIDGTEYFSNGATPAWIAELSDSSIVQTYEIDKSYDDNFPGEYSDWPIRMKWFDKDGNPTHEKLLVYPHLDETYFNQIEAGKGDYFFGFGTYVVGEPTDYITVYSYGLLTKFANNGDTIWTHRYQYNAFDSNNVYFHIKDIEELDNGDIVALGDIFVPGQVSKIWMFKVNSEGCFGEDSCDEVQRTKVLELENDFIPLKVYPNPTSDNITISLSEKYKWKWVNWKIFDLKGDVLLKGRVNNSDKFIISGMESLKNGLYVIKVYDKEFNVSIGKFIVK